jgi:8-oxo-dGTP diphosphatase
LWQHKILLANHAGLNPQNQFWCPPGGGVQASETLSQALIREFLEETKTHIQVGNYINMYQHIVGGLHAIELFFEVKITDGSPTLGTDPEHSQQTLHSLAWLSASQINSLPKGNIHQAVIDYLK